MAYKYCMNPHQKNQLGVVLNQPGSPSTPLYGMVSVMEGVYAGRTGYYDDDDINNDGWLGVVYFSQPFVNPVKLPHSWLRPATFPEIALWHEHFKGKNKHEKEAVQKIVDHTQHLCAVTNKEMELLATSYNRYLSLIKIRSDLARKKYRTEKSRKERDERLAETLQLLDQCQEAENIEAKRMSAVPSNVIDIKREYARVYAVTKDSSHLLHETVYAQEMQQYYLWRVFSYSSMGWTPPRRYRNVA